LDLTAGKLPARPFQSIESRSPPGLDLSDFKLEAEVTVLVPEGLLAGKVRPQGENRCHLTAGGAREQFRPETGLDQVAGSDHMNIEVEPEMAKDTRRHNGIGV
jgi:hypothetical protein